MKTFKTGLITKCLLLMGLALSPAILTGQIKLSQSMSPGGTFGLVDVNELKGGLMMVDNLADRDQIFMNRTKRGMMVVVLDADAVQAGDQTKTFMFTPSEDPADYSDGGKIWNTYDEYSVHTIAQFVSKYALNPWIEVSLGFKDPNGPGIDSIFISTSFIDTIFSNTGDTIFLINKTKADSLYIDYLNLSGVQVLGISTDETFANASNDSIVTQLAIKTYIQSQLASLSANANISKLTVDTLIADSAYIADAKIDTLESNILSAVNGTVDTLISNQLTSVQGSVDSLKINALAFDGDTITGISTNILLGGAGASNDSLSTQLAVKTYVDDRFADFGTNANISKLTVDTLIADSAFIASLRNNVLVTDSINVDTLIALYTTIDTASINKVSVNYFTLDGYYVTSVSNDTMFTSASPTALITEFAVQNRIDSVMVFVNNEFSNLSQNSIENPLNAASRIVVNENDSLVFMVNGDTAMVVSPDGTVHVDTLSVQQLIVSGDTINGISTDVNMGGLAASNDSVSTQLAVKTYVDAEIAKLSGATSTDTLRANVAIIKQSYLDSVYADSLYAVRAKVDTLYMTNDTIYNIAKTGETVADTALDNTLVTAGYVKTNATAFPEGLNPVTRAGWTGVSGQDLNADNVVDFLKRVFFPVPEPTIADFRFDNTRRSYETPPADPNGQLIETISPRLDISYTDWKASGYTLPFTYSVDNRSAADPNITTTNIVSVALASSPGTFNETQAINNANLNVTGYFTVPKAAFGSPSATTANDYTFTMTVTDAYPNVNTLTFPVRLLPGTQLTVNYFRINGVNGPIVVEGDGANKVAALSWSINAQEDTITAISILQELPSAATIPAGSTSATGSFNQTITAPATQGTFNYRYDLQVGSEVYAGNVTTNVNRVYTITDRHFWGYIQLPNRLVIDALPNGSPLNLNAFFTNPPFKGDALNKNWAGSQPNAGIATGASAADGILFTTATAGDVYACFAIPRTTGSVELHQWDDLNKFWVNQSGVVAKPITYTVGTITKNYWIVYSTTAFSSTATPIFRVVEK